MEEKIIIKGKPINLTESRVFGCIGIGLLVLALGLFRVGCKVCCALEGLLFASPILVLIIIFSIMCIAIKNCTITVTNKRVYGKTSFGKQVDLPLDSISSVGTSAFQGIAVGTSSGRIKFLGISDRNKIYEAIKNILAERQSTKLKTSTPITNITQEQSSADELKKFKDLLDSGIITQEEFDAKKKQLLGL